MAGEVLDVNSLSTFHSSLYILRNGNGYLDLRFFVDFQTIATVGRQIVTSAGNITVSVISNILQLIVGSRGTGAFRNRIVGKFQLESAGSRIIRSTLIQDEVILCAANTKKAAGLAAKGQLAVSIFGVGAVGTIGVGKATSGEHAGTSNGNGCNSRVLHKITAGECIRHNNSSFE